MKYEQYMNMTTLVKPTVYMLKNYIKTFSQEVDNIYNVLTKDNNNNFHSQTEEKVYMMPLVVLIYLYNIYYQDFLPYWLPTPILPIKSERNQRVSSIYRSSEPTR